MTITNVSCSWARRLRIPLALILAAATSAACSVGAGADDADDLPAVPCDTNACISSDLPGQGCATPGDECQTIDCHGMQAALVVCTDEKVWTAWSDLHFACGEEICDRGVEYCEDISDAGSNQQQHCRAIPSGCSTTDFCSCQAALDVCSDAMCATFSNDNWVVTCW